MRKFFLGLFAALALAAPAVAHHGWAWITGGNIELTGVIQSARLGNSHGILEVDAEGEVWTVEMGQSWRHERAGLDEGVAITLIGEPSANIDDKRMKAEQVILGGETFALYPDRS
jgi:hypothetical protein